MDVHRVTLVTGDRVVVGKDAAGHIMAYLSPSSPDFNKPLRTVVTGSHVYVVPQLAPSLHKRLDPSVFDVSALDPASGRVSLDVTFDAKTAPHRIPGLQLSAPAAGRQAHSGAVTVHASYDASRPPVITPASLRGVSRVAVRGDGPTVAAGYELHTLTINATTATGTPLNIGDLFVFNADDGGLFSSFGFMVDG